MSAIRAIITTVLVILLGLYAFQTVFSMVRFGGIQWIHLLFLAVLVVLAIIWFRGRGRPGTKNADAEDGGGENSVE